VVLEPGAGGPLLGVVGTLVRGTAEAMLLDDMSGGIERLKRYKKNDAASTGRIKEIVCS